ncbi:MAG: anti-sigma factor [Reichenbachiella sp.]|uniref:anti-sigma factor n=1 Tax=Reichenbachiella sp. TaxID=2184521 RepID=UPI0032658D2F
MNIEEYISSGILEQYALGELSQAEMAEVQELIEAHPQIKAELDLITSTLETLALKTAINPPTRLKNAIKAELDLEKEAKEIQLQQIKKEKSFSYAVAASISVAILASALAFFFYGQWRSAENQLEVLIAQNQEVADNYEFVNQQLKNLENDVDVLANPAYTRVAMSGTDNSPESLATVYWNANTEEVYLKIQNLRTLSQSEQYQLWAIVDGVPVDMGVFDSESNLLKMKSVGSAAAFAVTIEPRGGSENPSLQTMQVLGTTEV